MTTLRINITREVLERTKDCEEAKHKNCAISYAVREIWPTAITGYEYIYPFNDWMERTEIAFLHFPHYQQDFILDFDAATPAQRAAMTPFSFDIEVPDEVISEINIDEVRRICDGSRTLELVK